MSALFKQETDEVIAAVRNSRIKQAAIASQAGIRTSNFSRLMTGRQGATKSTCDKIFAAIRALGESREHVEEKRSGFQKRERMW